MTKTRSLLLHGLGLTLRRLPAVLWAFAFNFVYAALNSTRVASAIGHVTGTSMAAQPLSHGFDLGTLAPLLGIKLAEGPGLNASVNTSIVLYLATYFLLVPGTLLCYLTGARAKLSTLFQAGLTHFWRFVRITLLALIVFGLILGPLGALQSKWAAFVDDRAVGLGAFLAQMAGVIVIALVAAVLRLYFDLVEVYTVQLGLHLHSNGKPDRRVRKTLLPALRALRANFSRIYPTFVLLAILGFATFALFTASSVAALAQSHVWPMFLHLQIGLFLMLFTRFWQRGAETMLVLNYPIIEKPVVRTTFVPRESQPIPIQAHDPGAAFYPQEPPIASPS